MILISICGEICRFSSPFFTVLQIFWFHFPTHEANLSHFKFQGLYRLSKTQFRKLLKVVCSKLVRYHLTHAFIRASISMKIIVFFSLRLIAAASYLDVWWPYVIAESTFHMFSTKSFLLSTRVCLRINFLQKTNSAYQTRQSFKSYEIRHLTGLLHSWTEVL